MLLEVSESLGEQPAPAVTLQAIEVATAIAPVPSEILRLAFRVSTQESDVQSCGKQLHYPVDITAGQVVSSPHARGFFPRSENRNGEQAPFPARAGSSITTGQARLTRASSPHAQGFFLQNPLDADGLGLFPADAEVLPSR